MRGENHTILPSLAGNLDRFVAIVPSENSSLAQLGNSSHPQPQQSDSSPEPRPQSTQASVGPLKSEESCKKTSKDTPKLNVATSTEQTLLWTMLLNRFMGRKQNGGILETMMIMNMLEDQPKSL